MFNRDVEGWIWEYQVR